MQDLFFCILTIAFFGLMLPLIRGFESLRRGAADE